MTLRPPDPAHQPLPRSFPPEPAPLGDLAVGRRLCDSLTAQRAAELAKYRRLRDSAPDYGAGAHYQVLQPGLDAFIREQGISSLLDVGCGRGDWPRYAYADLRLQTVVGADPVFVEHFHSVQSLDGRSLWWLPTPAHELSWQYRRGYDLVTAFDVLEHLLPAELGGVLRDLARIARRAIVCTVATIPDRRRIDGVDVELHPSVMPVEHWHSLLAASTGMQILQAPTDTPWRTAFWCTKGEE